tara:strand:- start:411 stop:545 length:135 start_codon:yes stop_codon:yes gene_type:complete
MELKIKTSLSAFANKEEHIKVRDKVKIYLERIEQLNNKLKNQKL